MPNDVTDEIFVEADVYAMLDHLDKLRRHIEEYVPEELIYKENGEPNVRTRWGAIVYHLQYMRATLRSFITA